MSEQHRRNVASLPCISCGIEGYSQAAHANNYWFGKGRGLKASDFATFPLCCTRPDELGCHVRHDQYADANGNEAAEIEARYVIKTLMELGAMGKLKAVK